MSRALHVFVVVTRDDVRCFIVSPAGKIRHIAGKDERTNRHTLLSLLLLAACSVTSHAYNGRCAFQSVARNKFYRSYTVNDHMITTRNDIGSSEIYRIDSAGAYFTIQNIFTNKYLQVNLFENKSP